MSAREKYEVQADRRTKKQLNEDYVQHSLMINCLQKELAAAENKLGEAKRIIGALNKRGGLGADVHRELEQFLAMLDQPQAVCDDKMSSRQLVYSYYELPFVKRYDIAVELGVLQPGDGFEDSLFWKKVGGDIELLVRLEKLIVAAGSR